MENKSNPGCGIAVAVVIAKMIEPNITKLTQSKTHFIVGGVKNDLSVVSCIYLTITNTYQCTPP
jgi:hypothetical protein